jgi:hypothetical protein
MQPAHRDEILSSVRADIAADETVVADARRQIAEAETRLAELRRIEAYLTQQGAGKPSHLEPIGIALPDGVSPKWISTDEIAHRAEGFLRSRGPADPQKALAIAQHIFPDYDPLKHGRNFENRIFSILKRRSDRFVKAARGRWTLYAFITERAWATDEDMEKARTAERPF